VFVFVEKRRCIIDFIFFKRQKRIKFVEIFGRTMSKRSVLYQIFCSWVKAVNLFYYPKRYYLNRENIPSDGNPIIMVGNHQNCMMDPVNVELALSDRKAYSLTRGDVFRKNNVLSNFMFWIGLLPVNRLSTEGLNGKTNAKDANRAAFTVATKRVAQGNTLIVFPESRHQNKRWLGYFSLGYLHIAFQTAEHLNFEKEVYIQPFAHHYEDYFHARHDFMLTFGTPIALSDFYEKYQQKPRTTMREVNELVEKQIHSLMLNITDLEHYTAIDALREGPFGYEFAKKHGYNPYKLPEKLLADKLLVNILGDESKQQQLDKLQSVETEIQSLGMDDCTVAQAPNIGNLLLHYLILIIAAPFAAVAFTITFPVILAPRIMDHTQINGEGDEMFRSTWNVGISTLITLPVFWILASGLLAIACWKSAIAYFALYPILILIVIAYCTQIRKTKKIRKYVFYKDAIDLHNRRKEIIKELNI